MTFMMPLGCFVLLILLFGFIGCAFLAPSAALVLLGLLSPVVHAAFGLLGRLATRGIVAALSRTSVAIAALMIAVSAAMMLGAFAASAWLARSPWFNPAFGFPPGETAPSFLLFGLLSGIVTFWFAPLGNLLSRRHEYEADAFARDAMGGPAALVGALRKLAQKNLSNLTPHPWFSGFYYSHPTLVEREAALAKG